MATPNTLIFVDLTSDDPAAAGEFYAKVFGWTNEGRPKGVFHRLVPGGNMKNPDGSDSPIGNLHIGIHNCGNVRPHPEPDGTEPRNLAEGRRARLWVLVSPDDSVDRILDTAKEMGAEILWRNHFWKEFNGINAGFRDPWGNEINLWIKAGDPPQVPDDYTRE